MTSHDIEQIISSLKSEPNSLWKNKTLSHLQNALATSKMLELGKYTGDVSEGLRAAYNASNDFHNPLDYKFPNACACPEGAYLKGCPIHG